jgi:NADH-quinone oxidoreductase subunit L
MESLLLLAWLSPFIGTLLILLFKSASWRIKSLLGILSILVSALVSSYAAYLFLTQGESIHISYPWVKSLNVSLGAFFDGLSTVMALVVSWLSFLIAVYSYEYMKGEVGETRYWLFFTFFVGSMMLLVLSDNMISMFIGWEGTGLASYALIGHWFTDEEERWVGEPGRRALGVPMWSEPSHSSLRAIVFTRLGDVGMVIGIATLHTLAGTTLLSGLLDAQWATQLLSKGVLPVFLWLLFLGALAKSAQFPFHEWLVTAMTGPTSVSALIHAATMVKAGVYFALRFSPFLVAAYILIQGGIGSTIIEEFLVGLAVIGAFTAFMMATMAIASRELKLVLAFSTASQLGYMFLGVAVGTLAGGAVGGLYAGMSHLMSHAVFKAALFLGAGAVIHAVHSRFIDDMGGLAKEMPFTATAFVLASLSLAGVPPFLGFWTKDEIIHLSSETGLIVPTFLAVITAWMTASYTARMISRVFFGHSHHKAHEVSPVMFTPYLVLGLASIGIGAIWPSISGSFEKMLEHTLGGENSVHMLEGHIPGTFEATIILVLLLFLSVFYIYSIAKKQPYSYISKSPTLMKLHSFLFDRWYINALYYTTIVDGFKETSKALYKYFDTLIVDNFYHKAIPKLFQKLVNVTSIYIEHTWDLVLHHYLVEGFKGLWRIFKQLQTGKVSSYLLYLWLGLSLILVSMYILGWFP